MQFSLALLENPGITAWAGLVGALLLLLVVDLFIVRGRDGAMSIKAASVASVIWVAISLVFFGLLWIDGSNEDAKLYLAGYLVEKSLSLDNVFVFLLIFTAFGVAEKQRHKLLTYGIIGALVLRAIFIVIGAAALERFGWISFLMAALLIWTGWRMFQSRNSHDGEEELVQKLQDKLPITTDEAGGKLSTKIDGKRMLTLSGAALVAIAIADLIFAIDSVPAILAITPDPFIVFAANAFALLGLRPLFFLVAELVSRLHYLKAALAFLLMFIGGKMLYTAITDIKVGPEISLPAICAILGVGVIASLIRNRRLEASEEGSA